MRSHKNTEENEIILDLGAVTQQDNLSNSNKAASIQGTQMSSMSLLRQLLRDTAVMAVPVKTRELLQDILAWQILPSDSPTEPSVYDIYIYGRFKFLSDIFENEEARFSR